MHNDKWSIVNTLLDIGIQYRHFYVTITQEYVLNENGTLLKKEDNIEERLIYSIMELAGIPPQDDDYYSFLPLIEMEDGELKISSLSKAIYYRSVFADLIRDYFIENGERELILTLLKYWYRYMETKGDYRRD